MTVLLRTRCGCERLVDVPWLEFQQELVVPLYTPVVHRIEGSEAMRTEPVSVRTRKFAYYTIDANGGHAVYLERV
jgi:hypothetical protein